MVTFTTQLWGAGGNNVGIVVPEEILLGLGRGRRVPVRVTIDGGYSYRTTTATMGGRHLVSFNADARRATSRGAGDTVEVTLEVDDGPRTVAAPPEIAADPAASAAWQALAPSKQRALAAGIANAKTNDTRARRVAKALEQLTGQPNG